LRQVITFDAYGTLIDFRVMRFQAVLEPYRGYAEVLRSSLRSAMRLHA
jgi:2-haloacid dehalogenase